MAFFVLTRFVLVKYSRAFVKRPSQGTSSFASQLTTVSLDLNQKHPGCKKVAAKNLKKGRDGKKLESKWAAKAGEC